MTRKLYDRPSDIPEYKSKRIRLWSWVPKGYAEFIDGVWWYNSLRPKESGAVYEFAPGTDVEDNKCCGWEEYVDWKAELRHELSQLREALDRRHQRNMRMIWALESKIDKM